MKTLVRNYDSLFNEFFNNLPVSAAVSPSANIKETENAYAIELAIPGFTKDNFKIEVHDRTLNVSSVSQADSEEKKENYIRKEFSYNSFSRSFRLPRAVDTDQISATYENGVLNLELPKKEEAKVKEPRLISVN
ncbi:MAG: Hsp20/alpha crystallin family protein [Leadbetterella sp.]|nr:Hsp20/alpha crystallin family protein [Leadbetterella sp.]